MKAQIINDQIIAWGTQLEGPNIFEPIPADYSPERYQYLPQTQGTFDPNGFIPIPQTQTPNLVAREDAVRQLSTLVRSYMTEMQFQTYTADVATIVQGYLMGGNRLISWFQTVQANGANYTNTGWLTRAYAGSTTAIRQEKLNEILPIIQLP
jgi:hypothetical protein